MSTEERVTLSLLRYTAGAVDVVCTDREGGVSTGPWSSLNLGTGGGDDPANVRANLAIVAEAVAARQLVSMTQVHGAEVYVVKGYTDVTPAADALVTDMPDTALMVRVADCLPVALADVNSGIIAVAHAGRTGMQNGIIAATVAAMTGLGASAIQSWLGPRACGRCYEVPAAMADEVAAVIPAARSTTSWGTAALDIGAGVRAQLEAEGVSVDDIGHNMCTIEDERWFSYRRQGADSGRFSVVVTRR